MHRQPVLVCHQFILLYLALQVLLLAVPGYGCEQPDAFARADTTQAYSARFQSLLDTAVRGGLPGVSLRVNGPGVDFQGAAGVADLTTGEALTTKHAMYMASLGKTFTAAIALQLCDEGRLTLEAPIANWLPGEVSRRIPASGNITLRQLLSHTSGIIDYRNDAKAWTTDFVSDPQWQWSQNEVVAFV